MQKRRVTYYAKEDKELGVKLRNKPDATRFDQSTAEVENGALVSQQSVPANKGSKRNDKMKFLIQ